jgi:hypothetical protein
MNKYYILEKFVSDTEGLTVKSPYTYFSESVIECNDLGENPFSFKTLQEAKDCKKGLDLLFVGRNKDVLHYEFIIVEEIK